MKIKIKEMENENGQEGPRQSIKFSDLKNVNLLYLGNFPTKLYLLCSSLRWLLFILDFSKRFGFPNNKLENQIVSLKKFNQTSK